MEDEEKKYGKRPQCFKCKEAMRSVYMRNGTYRYTNLGYYCKTCKTVYINNGIKIGSGPIWIGMKKVIS